MKFDFSKSSTPDLQNKISINKLDIINSNLLYLTHEIDQIKVLLNQLINDTKLQTQVDEYFEKPPEEI